MSLPDYDSPSVLKAILDSRSMAMQKKFGQNFLINSNARTKLAESLDLEPGMKVWEVGPGLGALTTEILKRDAKLTAFEIDRGFVSFLQDEIQPLFKDTFEIVSGDVLKTWKDYYAKNGKPDRFFGNLPYNVAAAIIADMIENELRFDKAVVTVQKEVALRMAAKPGTEDYSSFSVLCQWAYDVTPVMDLAGGCFWPRPNVDSRAVKFVKKEVFPGCKNPKLFLRLVRTLFTCRRKTIKNNMNIFTNNSELSEKILNTANIDTNVRVEKLDIQTLLHLSDVVNDIM
jgi:16S rRNA (adenine1518-N6/adenine1519-N6)-dimethyltransferase